MKPYYEQSGITIYHGDCREILESLAGIDAVVTDPPYPNGAGHFVDAIPMALDVFSRFVAPRWFVFWSQLDRPPVRLPVVARHIWHRTNTNRPDNYEAIYEFAAEPERHSRVFPHAVVYPGLTGCVEATGHPTQKPEALMRIEALVDEQPFADLGSTAVERVIFNGLSALLIAQAAQVEELEKRQRDFETRGAVGGGVSGSDR